MDHIWPSFSLVYINKKIKLLDKNIRCFTYQDVKIEESPNYYLSMYNGLESFLK